MPISEKRILIALPKKLKDLISREAKKRHLTKSGLIRMALGQWIEQAQLKDKLERDIGKRKK